MIRRVRTVRSASSLCIDIRVPRRSDNRCLSSGSLKGAKHEMAFCSGLPFSPALSVRLRQHTQVWLKSLSKSLRRSPLPSRCLGCKFGGGGGTGGGAVLPVEPPSPCKGDKLSTAAIPPGFWPGDKHTARRPNRRFFGGFGVAGASSPLKAITSSGLRAMMATVSMWFHVTRAGHMLLRD